MKYIRFFEELGSADLALAGGKGANLGELVKTGLRVPPGFVLTVEGYRRCVPAVCLPELDVNDLHELEQVTAEVRRHVEGVVIAGDVVSEVKKAYARLGKPAAAVRSSATAEDLPGASFAGQQETFLDVRGEEALLEAVRKCWASLWTARAVQYRALQGFGASNLAMAVVVQEMAPHAVSGVVFTINPLSGKPKELLINATYGLGEALVGGEVIPDQWVARRPDGAVLRFISARRKGQSYPVPLLSVQSSRGCLTSNQVRELACIAFQIEVHFGGVPQDIEWSYGGGHFYMLQSRPITKVGVNCCYYN